MNLLAQTQKLCRLFDIKPARSKGQSFLISESIYDKIIDSADLKAGDIVLEIGPGLGFLTAKLAKIAKKIITVELDDKLAAMLETGLKAQKVENVEVVNENILDFKLPILGFTSPRPSPSKGEGASVPPSYEGEGEGEVYYKIVANLPYNITSVFLRKFLSATEKPTMMVLMLQKEVAERVCARAGDMSLLAVSVQFYAEPEIIEYVPKENFWPRPEVDSAIVKIKPHPDPLLIKERGQKVPLLGKERLGEVEKKFFQLVKIGFSARRKMLKNNLAAGFRISNAEAENRIKKAGFSQNCRAQELTVEDWLKLLPLFTEK